MSTRPYEGQSSLPFPLLAEGSLSLQDSLDLIPVTNAGIYDIPLQDVIVPEIKQGNINPTIIRQIAESIETIGQLHPILMTPDNVLITGLQRLEALRLLGRPFVRAAILPVSTSFAELVAIDENLFRRGISTLEQGELIVRRTELLDELGLRAHVGQGRPPAVIKGRIPASISTWYEGNGEPQNTLITGRKTTKELAAEYGISERVFQQRAQIVRHIPKDVRDTIRTTALADCRNELLRLAQIQSPEEQRCVVRKVIAGEATGIREAQMILSRETRQQKFQKVARSVRKLPDTIQLIHGDFIEQCETYVPEGSLDLILTEPLYSRDFQDEWEPLLILSHLLLKPGGFFVSMCGHVDLPEIFRSADRNKLEFFWLLALIHKGARKTVHARSVRAAMKPIVAFYRPPLTQPSQYFTDIIEGTGRDKSLHVWQQGVEEFRELLQIFSNPGDCVMDPFFGTGSVALACFEDARRFIGFETNQERVEVARGRLIQISSQDRRESS